MVKEKHDDFNIKRLLRLIFVILLAFYFVNMLLAFSFSEKLIFQPQPSSYHDDAEIIKLDSTDGAKISARFFPNPFAEYTILFNHGNAEDVGTTEYFLEQLKNAGFNVFTFDYQGYGTSEGTPSEQKSYEDARAAYLYLTEALKIPPEKIIIHGRSLGGAVAIDLAAREKCGGLIVESSFVSAFRVVTKYRLLPFDKFQNLSKIKSIKCPILFVHGRKDELIPFWHSEKLFAEAAAPKFSMWIDEGNHNNIFSVDRKAYLEKIRDFVADLPK